VTSREVAGSDFMARGQFDIARARDGDVASRVE
jgi:hypothetical protein